MDKRIALCPHCGAKKKYEITAEFERIQEETGILEPLNEAYEALGGDEDEDDEEPDY